jgi:hypothetical protein
MTEDYALPIELHRSDCLCVKCKTLDHDADCTCWMCESRRYFFERPERRERELVESDVVATHLRRLAWPMRRVAAEAGVSVATAWKASHAGRQLEQSVAERLLRVGGDSRVQTH